MIAERLSPRSETRIRHHCSTPALDTKMLPSMVLLKDRTMVGRPPTQSLREQLDRLLLAQLRHDIRFFGSIVGIFAGIGAAVCLIGGGIACTRAASSWIEPFADRLQRADIRNQCDEIATMLREVFGEIPGTLFMRFWLPFVFALVLAFACVLAISFFGNRKLFNRPGLAQQLILFSHYQVMHRGRLTKQGVLLFTIIALCVPFLAVFDAHAIHAQLLVLTTLAATAVLVLRWEYCVQKEYPIKALLTPMMANRLCISTMLTLGAFLIGTCIMLSIGVFAARSCVQQIVNRLHMVEGRVHAWSDQRTSDPSLADLESDAVKNAEDYLVDRIGSTATGLSSHGFLVSLGDDRSNRIRIGLLSAFLFSAMAIGCLYCGRFIWRIEMRDTTIPVLTALLAAFVLEWISNNVVVLFEQVGWSNYLPRLTVVFGIFLAGQLSALWIRLGAGPRTVCSRCCSYVYPDQLRCTVCGTRLALLRRGSLVGNLESRELHDEACHHATRLAPTNRKMFTDAEDAYWEGFDNCGQCLGGSNFPERHVELDS